jgi:hypothetical protein
MTIELTITKRLPARPWPGAPARKWRRVLSFWFGGFLAVELRYQFHRPERGWEHDQNRTALWMSLTRRWRWGVAHTYHAGNNCTWNLGPLFIERHPLTCPKCSATETIAEKGPTP